MTTVADANVFNLAVQGTFDDCQDVVKALFGDAPFNSAYRLGAVNSINWARILAQITYYFSAYFALRRLQPSAERIQFAVPTGNFGDILAGWYARRLGLPTGGEPLVVATNANDILTRFWATGRYEKADSTASNGHSTQTDPVVGSSDGSQGGVKQTLSPAMDILVSSNFERLLWYLAFECETASAVANYDGEVDGGVKAKVRKAGEVVRGWMDELKKEGKCVMGDQVAEAARKDFIAQRVSDDEVCLSLLCRMSSFDGSYRPPRRSSGHTPTTPTSSTRIRPLVLPLLLA